MNRNRQAITPTFREPWQTIVIGKDRLILAHHRRTQQLHVPAHLINDPGTLLDQVAQRFAAVGQGVLITPQALTRAPDETPPAERLAEFMRRAAAARWRSTDAALRHGSGWTTFVRHGSPTVHLGVLDAMAAREADHGPDLFSVVDRPETIARALTIYHATIGTSYRAMPGVAGLAMLREHYERLKTAGKHYHQAPPRWQWKDAPEIATPSDLIWQRKPSKAETDLGYVHPFDVRNQYLAAALIAELGRDVPEPCGPEMFDPLRHGYWRIKVKRATGYAPSPDLPPVINPARVAGDGTTWVTTPVMVLLEDLGHRPEVLDTYLSVHRARILRPWAERIRGALVLAPTADLPMMRAAFKATYSQAIGLMGSPSALVRRPDWADTVRDLARCNLLRKIYAAARDHGITPIKVNRDCVYYPSEHATPQSLGVRLGSHTQHGHRVVQVTQIGKYKPEPTITMGEYLAADKARAAARKARR